MKKLFLTSTALVAGVAVASPAIAGGDPYTAPSPVNYSVPKRAHTHVSNVVTHADSALAVSLGGVIDFQAGFADVDDGLEINDRDVYFRNDTEVHVTVAGQTDSGLEYGAVIELEADVTGDIDEEGFNADKTYLFLQGDFGRVELGNNSSAAQTLKVDAATIARATGGIDGDFDKYINDRSGSYIVTPNLHVAEAEGTYEDATKITYYTPRFSGFQFGASYTPDTASGGQSVSGGGFEDVFSVGINYAGQYDNWGILASLTAEFGDDGAAGEDLEGYHAGLVLSAGGFSFAAGYGDTDDTRAANADASFWDAGISYENGPWGISLTYLDSEVGDAELQNFSLGADYQLASGLVTYIEYSLFDFDNGGSDEDGGVLILGTELTF